MNLYHNRNEYYISKVQGLSESVVGMRFHSQPNASCVMEPVFKGPKADALIRRGKLYFN